MQVIRWSFWGRFLGGWGSSPETQISVTVSFCMSCMW